MAKKKVVRKATPRTASAAKRATKKAAKKKVAKKVTAKKKVAAKKSTPKKSAPKKKATKHKPKKIVASADEDRCLPGMEDENDPKMDALCKKLKEAKANIKRWTEVRNENEERIIEEVQKRDPKATRYVNRKHRIEINIKTKKTVTAKELPKKQVDRKEKAKPKAKAKK